MKNRKFNNQNCDTDWYAWAGIENENKGTVALFLAKLMTSQYFVGMLNILVLILTVYQSAVCGK